LAKKNEKVKFKFGLGSRVKDSITGFEGIVVGRTQWLHNCNTYSVKPTVLKDGVPQKSEGFDEPQLSIVKEKVHKPDNDTGGPEREIPATNR